MFSYRNKILCNYLGLSFLCSIIFFILLSYSPTQSQLWFANFGDYMADFLNNFTILSHNDPYNVIADADSEKLYYLNYPILGCDRAYPPFAYFIFKLIFLITPNEPYARLAFSQYFIFCMAAFYLIVLNNNLKAKSWIKTLIILAFITSGIFMSSLERGNIIYLSCLGVAFFVFYNHSANKYIREMSLISLCVAVNIKIAPVIFGVMLWQEKRYKDIIHCIFYCCLMFFLPLLSFEGGMLDNIAAFCNNLSFQINAYSSRGNINLQYLPYGYIFSLYIYPYLAKFICIMAFFAFWFQKEYWKKIAIITVFMLVSSAISANYMLLYFFIFMTLFFSKTDYSKLDFIYMILFVIMFSPIQIFVQGVNIYDDVLKISRLVLLAFLAFESLDDLTNFILNKISKKEASL